MVQMWTSLQIAQCNGELKTQPLYSVIPQARLSTYCVSPGEANASSPSQETAHTLRTYKFGCE
jgi:hypothetical protein